MQWSIGLTTVSERKDTLLPRTLASLEQAGFHKPHLFIDGSTPERWNANHDHQRTFRWPKIKAYGNWILALWEMFIREPTAERYAIFQDDFVMVQNCREYLERCRYPNGDERRNGHPIKGYWNLYTFPQNQLLFPPSKERTTKEGRPEAWQTQQLGWHCSNQRGLGAVALVFDRDSVLELLASQHMAGRPLSAHRGWKAIDGGIVTSMGKEGRCEFVHNPSLVQHTGLVTTLQEVGKVQPLAPSFPGEEFNALSLLEEKRP